MENTSLILPDSLPEILKPTPLQSGRYLLTGWNCGDAVIVRAIAENLTGGFGKCFVGVRFYVGERELRAAGGERNGQCQFYEKFAREYVFRFVIPRHVTKVEFFIDATPNADIILHELQVYTLPNDYRTPRDGGIKFTAHLGMIGYAPRNTMAAFSLAATAGYRECVVNTNVTADGYLVALHNNTIDETSNGSGSIREMTLAEARRYDFGSWFDPCYAGEPIPLLDDILRMLSHAGVRPVLRLGSFDGCPECYAQIFDMVKRHGLAGRCTAKGFSKRGLQTLSGIAGDALRYGYCFQKYDSIQEQIRFMKSIGSNVYLDIAAPNICERDVYNAVSQNVPVEAWIVNDFEKIVRLSDMGVSGFVTDYFPMDGCMF